MRSLISRSPAAPNRWLPDSIAASIALDLPADVALRFGADVAEALAGRGELAFDDLDLVAERVLDRAAGLDEPVVGGDQDAPRPR